MNRDEPAEREIKRILYLEIPLTPPFSKGETDFPFRKGEYKGISFPMDGPAHCRLLFRKSSAQRMASSPLRSISWSGVMPLPSIRRPLGVSQRAIVMNNPEPSFKRYSWLTLPLPKVFVPAIVARP